MLTHNFVAHILVGGKFVWEYIKYENGETEEEVKFTFLFSSFRKCQKRDTIKNLVKLIKNSDITWIKYKTSTWEINLDEAKNYLDGFPYIKWLSGIIDIDIDFETDDKIVFDKVNYSAYLYFYITEKIINDNKSIKMNNIFSHVEILESIEKFKMDYKNQKKTAFIIMNFGRENIYTEISNIIKNALSKFGIVGLRADDKQYHDDLFYNVSTYMHGCSFGIAIYDRIDSENFNPNVSLEVGYLFAMNKPVCLLKEKSLKTLPTDLANKLYKEFDIHNLSETIPQALNKWLLDKCIISN